MMPPAWLWALLCLALPGHAAAETRLREQLATLSDHTGFALIVDADVDLDSTGCASTTGVRELIGLQRFLASCGMYAMPLDPGSYRIRRDGPGLSLSIRARALPKPDARVPLLPSRPHVFQPRLQPGAELATMSASSSDRRLRTIPNLYTVGEVLSLRGISRGEDEPQLGLIENGLPISSERLSAPLRLSSQSTWLSVISGPDSALRGPNALGGWIEFGQPEPLQQGAAVELRAGSGGRGLLRTLLVPWAEPARGQLAISAHAATQDSTVIRTAGGTLSQPFDQGLDLQFDWKDAESGLEARSYLLAQERDLGYPFLHLGPAEVTDPDARRSELDYDGGIEGTAFGASQLLARRHADGTQSRLELGWLRSERNEHAEFAILDGGEARERLFIWSRIALSTEIAHGSDARARISLQYLPRRLERRLSTAVVPGGELFQLPENLRNAGTGRIRFDNTLDEDLDSWLLSVDDAWQLGERWQLGARLGWALESVRTELTDRARSDDDCQLEDLSFQPRTLPCRTFFADGEVARAAERSTALALPALEVRRRGERIDQQLGLRRGYGRSRAALDLLSGRYRVIAPERIDAIEYSIFDNQPWPRWRVDLFTYRWSARRSFRRELGELGAVLINENDGGSAHADGLELTRYLGTAQWSLAASMGWLNARYRSGEFAGIALAGRRLEDAPRYTVSAVGSWRGDHGWFADLSVHLADATFLDATNQPDARRPATRLIDLSFGRRIGDWDLFAYANDVSDDAGYQGVIPRSGLGLLGNSYRLVEGPSVGVGVRWRIGAE